MANTPIDLRAPMASAAFKYNDDGSVNWGDMWDTFCALAQTGGPPHRGEMLYAPEHANVGDPAYQAVAEELVRGIWQVSGLRARPGEPGWLEVECDSPGMAHWLAQAIMQENVQSRSQENVLMLPLGETFTVKGEIKNVITVVAKTSHYWQDHLPVELQRAADTEVKLDLWIGRLKHVFQRKPNRATT